MTTVPDRSATPDASGSPRTLPANVAASLNAAQQALDQLERSLRGAGFAEGVAAYERMAEVLMSQYLLHASDTPAMAGGFMRLGETARRLFGLLHPYAAVTRQLATLAAEPPEPPVAAGRNTVLAELQRRRRRGASAQLLVSTTGLPKAAVEAVLAELVADGAVAARGEGATAMYVPADARGAAPRSRGLPVSTSGAKEDQK
jgi:hypothetical protein